MLKLGDFNISIEDSNGTSIYEGSGVPTSEFDIRVDLSDTYAITINGENVSGEIELNRIEQN